MMIPPGDVDIDSNVTTSVAPTEWIAPLCATLVSCTYAGFEILQGSLGLSSTQTAINRMGYGQIENLGRLFETRKPGFTLHNCFLGLSNHSGRLASPRRFLVSNELKMLPAYVTMHFEAEQLLERALHSWKLKLK